MLIDNRMPSGSQTYLGTIRFLQLHGGYEPIWELFPTNGISTHRSQRQAHVKTKMTSIELFIAWARLGALSDRWAPM
eukprot:154616-Pelagomonas_calceolata.AAC.6